MRPVLRAAALAAYLAAALAPPIIAAPPLFEQLAAARQFVRPQPVQQWQGMLLTPPPMPLNISSPPAFFGGGAGSRSSGTTSFSLSLPAGILAGDAIYAVVWQANATANAATITGFTQVYHNASAGPTLTILRKTAVGGESTQSVGATSSTAATCVMLVYRGGLGVVDVIGTIARNTGTASTASSVTPTKNGVLLALFGRNSSGSLSSGPSGMTSRASIGVSAASYVYDLTPSPAAATGTKTFTWATSANNGALLVQIT